MEKYQKFHVTNMVGTEILCAIADHQKKSISFEKHNSAQNMVEYLRGKECKEYTETYTQVWEDLNAYMKYYNIQ